MANISTDLYNIEHAARGETVRDAAVDAIKKINADYSPPKPIRIKFKPKGSSGLVTKDHKQFKTILET